MFPNTSVQTFSPWCLTAIARKAVGVFWVQWLLCSNERFQLKSTPSELAVITWCCCSWTTKKRHDNNLNKSTEQREAQPPCANNKAIVLYFGPGFGFPTCGMRGNTFLNSAKGRKRQAGRWGRIPDDNSRAITHLRWVQCSAPVFPYLPARRTRSPPALQSGHTDRTH